MRSLPGVRSCALHLPDTVMDAAEEICVVRIGRLDNFPVPDGDTVHAVRGAFCIDPGLGAGNLEPAEGGCCRLVRVDKDRGYPCKLGCGCMGEMGSGIACHDQCGIALSAPEDIHGCCLTRVVEHDPAGKIHGVRVTGDPGEDLVAPVHVGMPPERGDGELCMAVQFIG